MSISTYYNRDGLHLNWFLGLACGLMLMEEMQTLRNNTSANTAHSKHAMHYLKWQRNLKMTHACITRHEAWVDSNLHTSVSMWNISCEHRNNVQKPANRLGHEKLGSYSCCCNRDLLSTLVANGPILASALLEMALRMLPRFSRLANGCSGGAWPSSEAALNILAAESQARIHDCRLAATGQLLPLCTSFLNGVTHPTAELEQSRICVWPRYWIDYAFHNCKKDRKN